MMSVILLAEDDLVQRRLIKRMLEKEITAEFREAEHGAEALSILQSEGTRIGLALIDISMPVMDGIGLLQESRKILPNLPFIVLTASENVDDAVKAMQLGAMDFIIKPAEPTRLLTSVRNALALRSLQEEVSRLQQDKSPHYSFADIIETSPSLKNIALLGRKAASSEIAVLITGESGVGKEVFAHAIHRESARANKPFVSVNCGALPDNLVESTLFGHEKGSFTGAVAKSIGKCREADGGVLFLDEVGELKPETQVKLLRLLQQGEIEPVGSTKPVKVDVRVISATNRSLEEMMAEGRFREDLYYRLHGLPLHIPPLRERRKDIPILTRHLLERIAITERKPHIRMSEDAIEWMTDYGWPGNVRELQHMLARAVLLAEKDEIEAEHLVRWAKSRRSDTHASLTLKLESAHGHFKSMEALEHEIIEAALKRHDMHIGRAAAALGMGQSTLYKRMNRQTAISS